MSSTMGTIESRRSALLSCFFGISKKYGKPYSYPAQLTLMSLLERFHGIKISLRTLNRDLARLVKDGFITRMRRLTRKGILAGRFASTLYFLKRKAFKYVAGMKKWADSILSSFRLPRMANNKSPRENKIFTEASGDVEKMWNPNEKGRGSPILDPSPT